METYLAAWVRNPREFITPIFYLPEENRLIRALPENNAAPFSVLDLFTESGQGGKIPALPCSMAKSSNAYQSLGDQADFREDTSFARPLIESLKQGSNLTKFTGTLNQHCKSKVQDLFDPELTYGSSIHHEKFSGDSLGFFKPNTVFSVDADLLYQDHPKEKRGFRLRLSLGDDAGKKYLLPVHDFWFRRLILYIAVAKNLQLKEVAAMIGPVLRDENPPLLLGLSRTFNGFLWVSVLAVYSKVLQLPDEDLKGMIKGSEQNARDKLFERQHPLWIGNKAAAKFDEDLIF